MLVGLPFTIFKTVPVTFLCFEGAFIDRLTEAFAAFRGRLVDFFEAPNLALFDFFGISSTVSPPADLCNYSHASGAARLRGSSRPEACLRGMPFVLYK